MVNFYYSEIQRSRKALKLAENVGSLSLRADCMRMKIAARLGAIDLRAISVSLKTAGRCRRRMDKVRLRMEFLYFGREGAPPCGRGGETPGRGYSPELKPDLEHRDGAH